MLGGRLNDISVCHVNKEILHGVDKNSLMVPGVDQNALMEEFIRRNPRRINCFGT